MPGDDVRADWITLAGPQPCQGCGRGPIPTGRRALRFVAGPRDTRGLLGLWFHGFDCLGRRAEEAALEEDDRGSGRGEGLRELARWARQREHELRRAGQV